MNDEVKIAFVVLLLIMGTSVVVFDIVSAEQVTAPTQQSNKIFLNPFYRLSMNQNINYTYNVTINPPDKISSVLSAIISFDVYITPTVTFTLWVNGQPCNTPSYQISTTFSGSGQSRITFDCSNRITQAGMYTITLRPTQANTGSITGWVDLTYTNQPVGSTTIHGTEYTSGLDATAKVWLQLLDANLSYINNAVCYTDIYTPSNEQYIERALMTNSNHDGIFYYDLNVPIISGVYPVIAVCYYLTAPSQTYNYVSTYRVVRGTYDSGTIDNTYTIDGNFIRFKETTVNPVRNISVQFNITNGTLCRDIPEELMSGVSFLTTVRFDSVPNDNIKIEVYNYSSSSWITLSNLIPEGAGFNTVSNSISLANITKAGLATSTKPVQVRMTDTALGDTATSNLDVDRLVMTCDSFSTPNWQQVKGSSEIHVSSIVEKQFYAETLCGSSEKDADVSACAEFKNNLSYSNVTWGYLYDKIIFINSYESDTDSYYTYETQLSQDCTGLIDIVKTEVDPVGTSYSILDNVTLSSGTNDNCIINIPIIFNQSDREFDVEITQENYLLWELERDNDIIKYYRTPIESFCNEIAQQNNNPFIIPITGGNDVSTLYADNPIYLMCYRFIDDLYWFDNYYTLGIPINISGEFESYLYNIRIYYEETKDASDAVRSIMKEDLLINVDTLCGANSTRNDYSCAELKSPDSLFGSQEGYILENLTVNNIYNATINIEYLYETATAVDCTSVFQVLKQNGTTTDIVDDVNYAVGNSDNCIMRIPINMITGQPSYQIEIFMENYISWDILWARDKVNSWNDTINTFCQNISTNRSITYNLPINQTIEAYRNDSEVYFCYRAMDDLYWWYFFFDDFNNSGYDQVGEIESDHYESEFFWTRILDDFNTVKTYQRNLNQIQILQDILDVRQNTAGRVWNYTERNLTYYPASSGSINNTAIAEAVWSYNNRTLSLDGITQIVTAVVNGIWSYTGAVSSSVLNQISNSTWLWSSRNLTYYPDMNVTTQVVNVTTQIVNVQNVTVNATTQILNITVLNQTVNVQNVTVNVTTEIVNVTTQIVNVQNVTVNVTIQNVTVQNATINNSDVASAIWNHADRNLTFYPPMNVTTEVVNVITQNVTVQNYTINVQNVTVNVTTEIVNVTTEIVNVTTQIVNVQNVTINLTTQNVTVQNVSVNESSISEAVWNLPNRNLTYYENFGDQTNYSRISNLTASDVWNYNNRTLSSNGISQIVDAIWSYTGFITSSILDQISNSTWLWSSRNLTFYEPIGINISAIADGVWNSTNKNLSYYPPMNVTTQVVNVQNVTVNVTTQNVTVQDVTVNATTQILNITVLNQTVNVQNITLNVENVTVNVTTQVVNVTTQVVNVENVTVNVTTQEVVVQNVTINVTTQEVVVQNITLELLNVTWEVNPIVNLTTEVVNVQNVTVNITTQDVTVQNVSVNSTEIADSVWTRSDRNLTYYPPMNVTTEIVNITVQNVMINNTELIDGIWSYYNRSLTDYNQTDLINYSLIQNLIWNATVRTLSDFNFSVDVNVTQISDAVWSYYNRTLTNYNQSDLTNYTLIQELINSAKNNLTAQDIWGYAPDRNLTYYPPMDIIVNATVNVSADDIATAVWNYNGTISGNILNQFSNKISCVITNLLNLDVGNWGVDIMTC